MPVRGTLGARAVAIAWSVAFFIAVFILATPLILFAALAGSHSLQDAMELLGRPGPVQLLVQGVVLLVVGLTLTWLIGIKANRLTWAELRYQRGRRAAGGFGAGLAVGGLAALTAMLLAVAVGSAHWTSDAGDVPGYLSTVARTLALLAPAALAEEVLFRGVPLVLLAAAFGRAPALVALALAFGIGHMNNPNALALGIVNIVLAGIFLGLAFYAPGGIWTAFGAHLGWNGTLAALDAPVSGLPFGIPVIDYVPGVPIWLTGGPFGPEGGLAATIAFGAAAYAVTRRFRKDSA